MSKGKLKLKFSIIRKLVGWGGVYVFLESSIWWFLLFLFKGLKLINLEYCLKMSLLLANKLLVTQLCPTLCNCMDYSPPGYSVHGILQARTLEWVAIWFSKKTVSKEQIWMNIWIVQCYRTHPCILGLSITSFVFFPQNKSTISRKIQETLLRVLREI